MESAKEGFSYLDDFKIIKTLGSGYNAVVKLAEDAKGQLVAIKRYKSQTSDLQTLIDELTIMKNLNQENIVKLIAVRDVATYKRKDGTTYQCFAIILQYCGGGQLFDYICDTGKFSQKVTRTYFHQMMSGLHYLHEKGYAHRDIKPENLLLTFDFKLKLADFGFATLWKGKDGSGMLHTKLGTEGYMAPQIYTRNYEGKRTDVFAAGIILFIMYAGCPPFERTNDSDPYFKLLKAKELDKFWKYHERRRPPGYFGEGFRSVFIHMTAFDPKQRPNIHQIASHPWVQQQLCTHSEIKAQFSKRKEYMDQILEVRFKQESEESKLRLHEISTQSESQNRGQLPQSPFLELYNNEVHAHRKIAEASVITKDSLIIKQEPQFAVSLLKNKLRKLCVPLICDEENLIESQPDSGNLIFQKIQDSANDEIFVEYFYKYGTQVDRTQSLKVRLFFGLNSNKHLVVNFTKVDGNFFYFRKVVKQIKKGFIKND